MLIEAFKSHTQKLISAKKDKISNLMETTLAPLKGILETLRLQDFEYPTLDIAEFPRFYLKKIKREQTKKHAHENWIRTIVTFELSNDEISLLNNEFNIQEKIGLLTSADDMNLKIWAKCIFFYKLHKKNI